MKRSWAIFLTLTGAWLGIPSVADASTFNKMTSFYNSTLHTEHVYFVPTFVTGIPNHGCRDRIVQ
jgi:hypothetical protein